MGSIIGPLVLTNREYYSSYTGLFLVRDRSAEGHFYAGEGALRDLIASEHAAHQRGRKETLPKLFVLDLLREHP